MLSIVFDPSLLGAGEHATKAINDMLAWTRASRTDDELLLPGDAEQQHRQLRFEHGIEIDDVSWQQFRSLEGEGFQPKFSESEV
ncbi:hypothetical protein [Pantoea sp. At-9b]|uniref:hypothetical protein n=1 Tax=Pantoea sp. (strain At-9b) TaxID=592316 RepID=UPI000324911F